MRKTIYLIVAGILIVLVAFSAIKLRQFKNMWFKEKPNYLSYESASNVYNFEWSADTLGQYVEAHNAICFKTKIVDLPNMFSFQFDTGAATSVIYGNVLESLIAVGLETKIVELDGLRFLEEISVELGGSKTTLRMLQIMENYGANADLTKTAMDLNLGTIGSDFIDERVATIDFENEFVKVLQEREAWMSEQLTFEKFDFAGRRLMLPCKIDDKKLKLFYDSGSSAFGLITTKNRFKRYTKGNGEEIKYDANRRGSGIPIIHKSSSELMHIGGKSISLQRVSYVDMYARFQGLITPFTRIGGWLGNKPFIDHVMIIDTRKEEFSIYKSEEPKS